jgi:aldose 1-epimerase
MLATELGPAWPWPGRAVLSWHLGADALRSELAVTTEGTPFPAEVGWHPWFRRRLSRGEPLAWSMNARFVKERGPDMLPTGRTLDPGALTGPFDHAFSVPDGRVTLTWPGALELTLEGDVVWMVVFDESDDVVCIEPQTAPPDGLGADAAVVTLGAPRTATVSWRWRRLHPQHS